MFGFNSSKIVNDIFFELENIENDHMLARSLQLKVQDLYNYIADLEAEVDSLNGSLRECEYDRNGLQDQLDGLRGV